MQADPFATHHRRIVEELAVLRERRAAFTLGVVVHCSGSTYRKPGALERMQTKTCSRMVGLELIEGAGHWVQQEQPERFNAVLRTFLAGEAKRR